MHEPALASSVQPAATVCLRRKLLPYSIGHELLLWGMENPFVTYRKEGFDELPASAQISALIKAVMVCSRDWSENHRPMRGLKWWHFWNEVLLDWPEQVAIFRSYRNSGTSEFPMAKMPRASGVEYHPFGSPDIARLLNYISQYHQALIQTYCGSPFNFPLALAKMLYLTHLESEGAIWIENYQDAHNRERLKALAAQQPESGLAVGPRAVRESALKWNREHPECPVPVPEPQTPEAKN